jgi:hypothetical protein
MTMRFDYGQFAPRTLVPSLRGRLSRPRPILSVTLIGPTGTSPQDSLLDTGADDTVFPDWVAAQIGVDLTRAPAGVGAGIGQGAFGLRFAEVKLRIADNHERREWRAWVGFSAAAIRYPMLGYTGFLEYFTATFHGDRQEVELTVNGTYPGI